jgi:hypothetical protein
MLWFMEAGADCCIEPVVVLSLKARLPRLEHPERAMAVATKPTIATALFGA